MSTRVPVLSRRPVRHRISAAAAVVVLPIALTACGSSDDSGSGDPTSGPSTSSSGKSTSADLGKLIDSLNGSKSASVAISLDDASGNLKKSFLADSPDTNPALLDRVVGGKITIKVDPAGDKTIGDLQGTNTSDLAAAVKAVNFSIQIDDKDGKLADFIVVGGVLYGSVDLGKVEDIAREAGEAGFADQIDSGLAQIPNGPQLGTDLRAGKYVKLDLNPYIGQLAGLAGASAPSAGPSIDGKKLTDDLVAAVTPYTQITDNGKGKYKYEVQAKPALKAALGILSSLPGVGSAFSSADTADIDKLKDGNVKGTFELDGDHLKSLTLDLGSIVAIAPDDPESPAPNLDGASVKLDVDDSAGDIKAPDNVSGVNLDALVGMLAGSAFGG